MKNLYVAALTLVFIWLPRRHLVARGQENEVRSRTSNEWRPRSRTGYCVPRQCVLPDCFCAGTSGPPNMRNYDIPQMVMLTFDDSLNEEIYGYYKTLFRLGRSNPNGCPITATFYLSNNWTNYDLVAALHHQGHEFASHTITHRMPQSWWTHASREDWYREVEGQRDNIASKAGIPKNEITGLRVPYLELGGDRQFRMMRDVGLEYDATFMTGPYDEGGAWPFTLDYPPNWKYCSNNNCPKGSFPGLWELPLNRWIGPDGKPCTMMDSCPTQPEDRDDALGYMWYNFNRFYRGNRAPFGIHLHATWFRRDDRYHEALDAFIDAILELKDVYLVTASQVLDWMKDPHTISEINDFRSWKHSCFKRNVGLNDNPHDNVHLSEESKALLASTATTVPADTKTEVTTTAKTSPAPASVQPQTPEIQEGRGEESAPSVPDTGTESEENRSSGNNVMPQTNSTAGTVPDQEDTEHDPRARHPQLNPRFTPKPYVSPQGWEYHPEHQPPSQRTNRLGTNPYRLGPHPDRAIPVPSYSPFRPGGPMNRLSPFREGATSDFHNRIDVGSEPLASSSPYFVPGPGRSPRPPPPHHNEILVPDKVKDVPGYPGLRDGPNRLEEKIKLEIDVGSPILGQEPETSRKRDRGRHGENPPFPEAAAAGGRSGLGKKSDLYEEAKTAVKGKGKTGQSPAEVGQTQYQSGNKDSGACKQGVSMAMLNVALACIYMMNM